MICYLAITELKFMKKKGSTPKRVKITHPKTLISFNFLIAYVFRKCGDSKIFAIDSFLKAYRKEDVRMQE